MKKFLLLCLPFLISASIDWTFTLQGQSADWWNGNYRVVNESNPIGVIVLNGGPKMAIYCFLYYAVFMSAFIMCLEDKYAVTVCITACTGHLIGTHTWTDATKSCIIAAGILAACITHFMEKPCDAPHTCRRRPSKSSTATETDTISNT